MSSRGVCGLAECQAPQWHREQTFSAEEALAVGYMAATLLKELADYSE
jgi:hypothetical protein